MKATQVKSFYLGQRTDFMRKSNIRKIVAVNRGRKAMPGMSAMSSSPAMKMMPAMGQAPAIPGGIAAGMKKGGAAKKAKGGMTKKPKVGVAIMIAVGKKRGRG
jgi:hypothetical protein